MYEQSQLKMQCLDLAFKALNADNVAGNTPSENILAKAKELYLWVVEGRDFEKEFQELGQASANLRAGN